MSAASSPTSPTGQLSRFSRLGSTSAAGGEKHAGLGVGGARASALGSSGKFSARGGLGSMQKGSVVGLGNRDSSASRPYMFRSMGASLGTSYFLEKQAIVIDFGRTYTKVGFATESRPRHLIPTPELRARRQAGPELSCTVSLQEWIDILDKLLSKIFFHYLSVSPKDRRVVICDSVHAPTAFRSATAFLLFKRFSVPSIAWVTDLVLPLYLTGLSSGIVIDIGYESTRILATLHGVPILSAFGATACSGRLINARLQRALRKSLADQDLAWLDDENIIEDLKARTCYVSDGRSQGGNRADSWSLQTGQSAIFPLRDRVVATVSDEARWQPAEVLFLSQSEKAEDDDEAAHQTYCEGLAPCRGGDVAPSNLSIPSLFVEVLQKCPIDVRPVALQNVVVCGGGAMMRGLLPRLAIELRDALQKDPDTSKLAERLRFTPLDFAPICAVWTGGAAFGSLDGANDFTLEMHERGDAIPDYCKDGFA